MFIEYNIFVFVFLAICIFGHYYLSKSGREKFEDNEEKEQEGNQNDEYLFIVKKAVNRVAKGIKRLGKLLLFLVLFFARHQLLPPQELYEDKRWKRGLKVRIVIGGVTIYTMAVGNILLLIPLAVLGFPVFYILIQVVFSIVLILGFNWMRILFGLGAVGKGYFFLNAAIHYASINNPVDEGLVPYAWVVAIVGLAGGFLILFSRSVKEYIHYKKRSKRRK